MKTAIFNTTLNNIEQDTYVFSNMRYKDDKTLVSVFKLENNALIFVCNHEINATFLKINTCALNYFKTLPNYADIGIYLDDDIKTLECTLKSATNNYKVYWMHDGYKVIKQVNELYEIYTFNNSMCKLQPTQYENCFIEV